MEVSEGTAASRLVVDATAWGYEPALGESIAVDGCCLTVVAFESGRMSFDVIPQTLVATTLGGLVPGSGVNLEHAVTATTLLGGHVVQGHIDARASVSAVETSAEWRLRIAPPGDLMGVIVPKGSVTLNGVSLTVAAIGEDWFEVALIPETLERTNLGAVEPGHMVNIETDYLAKIVVNWLERREG